MNSLHEIITDPGSDDAIGLMFRVASASLKSQDLFVSASYGNRSTRVCYENSVALVKQFQHILKKPLQQIKVVHGASKALHKKKNYELEKNDIVYLIHEDIGFDQTTLPEIERHETSQHHYEKNIPNNSKIHILSLAATTELFEALDILTKKSTIQSVVMMGGVLGIQGNVDPHQEANFQHDPEATIKVFELTMAKKIPFVLIPLDVTELEDVLLTPKRLEFLRKGLARSPKALEIIEKYVGPESKYGSFYGGRFTHALTFPYQQYQYAGVPIHDLTAAVVEFDFLGNQQIFEYADVLIKPNTKGEIGVARVYMEPNFKVTLAGRVKNPTLLWETVLQHFQAYN